MTKRTFPQETEEDFMSAVIELAHLCRWAVAYFRKGRVMRHGVETYETAVGGDGKGFVDLMLFKPGHSPIMAELKSEKGKLSPEQVAWGELLKMSLGIRYFLWRPSDWDTLSKVLQE